MNSAQSQEKIFGNRLRVRTCGILTINNKLLLIEQINLKDLKKTFWLPPGGGIEFGESSDIALKREFKEETYLDVNVGNFLFFNEYINPPYHAIELFFRVQSSNSDIKIGSDPELSQNNQLIKNIAWLSKEDIISLKDDEKHEILTNNTFLEKIFVDRLVDKS